MSESIVGDGLTRLCPTRTGNCFDSLNKMASPFVRGGLNSASGEGGLISTNMNWHLLAGVFLPFLGTTAGAACVFFLRDQLSPRVQKALLGFASGVMVAASVWSLLVPAMNLSAPMGRFAFVPAAIGFLLGIGFLLALDHFIPHLHLDADTPEGTPSRLCPAQCRNRVRHTLSVHRLQIQAQE